MRDGGRCLDGGMLREGPAIGSAVVLEAGGGLCWAARGTTGWVPR